MTTYTITSHDRTFSIGEEATDTTDSCLTLVGRHSSGWGQAYAQNFVTLLTNAAGPNSPNNPFTGQLWFSTGTGELLVYNGGWNKIAASSADSLSTARNISLTGDASGSGSFNGSADCTISVTLPTVLNNPGSFTSPAITVDAKGRITSISNSGGDGTGPSQFVESFNGRSFAVTLTQQDVTDALTFYPVQQGGGANQAGNKIYLGWDGTHLRLQVDVTDEGPIMLQSMMGAYQTSLGFTPVNKAGDTMGGSLNMNGNTCFNLQQPVNGNDAATKTYVDTTKTVRTFMGSTDTGYNVTVSTSTPTGGNDGDVWYVY